MPSDTGADGGLGVVKEGSDYRDRSGGAGVLRGFVLHTNKKLQASFPWI